MRSSKCPKKGVFYRTANTYTSSFVSNEIIVFRPIVCFCERECCSKDDRRRRFKHRLEASVGADVESCCDESSPMCKQDCCTNEAENEKPGFFNKYVYFKACLGESCRFNLI